MASEAATLLDQLMGSTRNASAGDNVRETMWSDPEVCKSYLCGFCPSELFTNTKADMGTCYKTHDERLKKDYEQDRRYRQVGYEQDFLQFLERIVKDLDRKIVRGRERLRRSADAKQQDLSGEGAYTSEKLRNLNVEIKANLTELEQLGAMGHVEETQSLMGDLEKLEKERNRERHSLSAGQSRTLAGYELDANDFHEKMELCDVCGSFLVIGDTQCRVDAHLLGKQHMGFARIRAAITELRKASEEQWAEKQKERERRLSQRAKSPSPEPPKRRSRSRSRTRSRRYSRRSRSRERKAAPRSRSRSRDREKRRQRSRSQSKDRRMSGSRGRNRRRSGSRGRDQRRRRSRSREKNRRSHSRDRKRSTSRSQDHRRRSRSRSRERGRRSRSRSKERRRSHDQEKAKENTDERKKVNKEENGKPKLVKEDGEID